MPFWIFKKRDDPSQKLESLQQSLKNSFSQIKLDIQSVTKTIKNQHGHHESHKMNINLAHARIDNIEQMVFALQQELELAKQMQSNNQTAVQSKQDQTAVRSKQLFKVVQTPVQTAVQTGSLEEIDQKKFTPMERAIISILLNTDLKLSYDDLSVALGRDKSTIRGQVNNIKQKTNLLQENVEKDGKKRFYVQEEVKTNIFKQRNVAKVKSRS